jgi:WD40 repeat protein
MLISLKPKWCAEPTHNPVPCQKFSPDTEQMAGKRRLNSSGLLRSDRARFGVAPINASFLGLAALPLLAMASWYLTPNRSGQEEHGIAGSTSATTQAGTTGRSDYMQAADCLSVSADNPRAGLSVALNGGRRGRGISTVQIRSAAFSPDGKYLLVGFGSGKGPPLAEHWVIKLWNVKTGKEVRTLKGHENGGTAFVTFFPDSKHALSTGEDDTCKVWDVTTGAVVRQFGKWFSLLALSPNGKDLLVYYGNPGRLELWDARSGKMTHAFPEFRKHVRSIASSPDGKLALLGCDSFETKGVWDWSTVQVWDMEKGKIKNSFGDEKEGMSRPLVFSPDSKFALANYWDRKARKGAFVLWEVATGRVLRSLPISEKGAHEAAFGPGGKQVVVVDYAGYMRRFDAATGKQLWSVLLSSEGGPGVVAFSQHGTLALIVTRQNVADFGSVHMDLWDAVKGEHLHTLFPRYP